MSTPTPISSADVSVRCHTAYDLEVTLAKFLKKLFDGARLDNPDLNSAQPDEVPYDPTERAQTLTLKVSPRVVRGRIPRTVTGEIALDELPHVPSIIVQAVSAKVQTEVTLATTRLMFSCYDENPNGQGYQNVLNMLETTAIALTGFGQATLDEAYTIVLPFEWKVIEPDAFPHFIGEMECQWQLPSARPFVNEWSGQGFAIPIPGEDLELRVAAV